MATLEEVAALSAAQIDAEAAKQQTVTRRVAVESPAKGVTWSFYFADGGPSDGQLCIDITSRAGLSATYVVSRAVGGAALNAITAALKRFWYAAASGAT